MIFTPTEGYETEYTEVLNMGLDALIAKKSSGGVSAKEANLIFQLETHLGRKSVDDLLSRKAAAPVRKPDVENYN